MTPVFQLMLSDGSQADLMLLVDQAEPVGFTLTLSQMAARRLGVDAVHPGAYLSDRKHETITYTYPASDREDVGAFLDRHSGLLAAKRIGRLVVPDDDRFPTSIEPDDAAGIITSEAVADPSQIIFLTGAGMSHRAGPTSVDDIENFGLTVGFRDKDFDATEVAGEINDKFIRLILAHPEVAENILIHYGKELTQALSDLPTTPGHAAISDLIRAFERRPGLITSNYDMLHEAEGSRLQPLRSRRAWEVREIVGIGEDEKNARDQTRREIRLRARGTVSLIVASAMSSDSHGIMRYIKSSQYQTSGHQRPAIMAINTQDNLPYLGRGDYIVRGEAKDVLGEIAHLVIPGWHPVRRARRLMQDIGVYH